MQLYRHQIDALNITKDLDNVAFYHPMGSGKTYTGSEKMLYYNTQINLVVCQKSKIDDWIEHFLNNYDIVVYNLTNNDELDLFLACDSYKCVGVINYDLLFRRPNLLKLRDFTLMLDESSLIQNERTKRTKFIFKMRPAHIILLSGTPVGGKYEKLWSQMHLLGWNISRTSYWNTYVNYHIDKSQGFPVVMVKGYKREKRLKEKMREYGCNFLTENDLFDLPEQIHQTINISTTKEYKKFKKNCVVSVEDTKLVGDTLFTKILYERQLCGQYCKDKLNAFKDLVDSTEDRLIVFYNFTAELELLRDLVDRPVSIVNGNIKDLSSYEIDDNSITFIQYQAGAMGLNLQKANKIIYFTPPMASELFEQSKKRTHRIGQTRTCRYYYLTCKNSIEEKIYKTLAMRRDYTEALFKED